MVHGTSSIDTNEASSGGKDREDLLALFTEVWSNCSGKQQLSAIYMLRKLQDFLLNIIIRCYRLIKAVDVFLQYLLENKSAAPRAQDLIDIHPSADAQPTSDAGYQTDSLGGFPTSYSSSARIYAQATHNHASSHSNCRVSKNSNMVATVGKFLELIDSSSLWRKLPAELRIMMWKLSIPQSRVVDVVYDSDQERYFSLKTPVPNILHICSESRDLGMEHYKQQYFGTKDHLPNIYMDLQCDILLMDEWGANSHTETPHFATVPFGKDICESPIQTVSWVKMAIYACLFCKAYCLITQEILSQLQTHPKEATLTHRYRARSY
jgi:hypothetical protein